MYYGPTPCAEECTQTTDPDYFSKSRDECRIWLGQLLRLIKKEWDEVPEGLNMRVKGESHDFGTYYEVVGIYHIDNDEARDVAGWLENTMPEDWDEEARAELAKLGR